MRILQITAFSGWGCTGRIALGIHRAAEAKGHKGTIAWGRCNTAPGDVSAIQIGTPWDYRLHGLYTRLTDRCGFGSVSATKRFLKDLDAFRPDLVQCHILHGYYINLELLFTHLKSLGIPVVWTFHDCWAFTGHCPYFDLADCSRWQTGCYDCPQKHHHPESWFLDHSADNWKRKRDLFAGLKYLHIVTPSEWLAGLVRHSFLKDRPVTVIPNGINIQNFHPVNSDILTELGIPGKKMILGVSSTWASSKGIADFTELAEKLPQDYKVVLVGLDERQIKTLPGNILGIPRTDSIETLARLYTAASVFVNPTYEDNYPTTNLEAIACGTPVVTYDTGGSPESVLGSGFGMVIPQGDTDALAFAVISLANDPPGQKNPAFVYDEAELYKRYVSLYEAIATG